MPYSITPPADSLLKKRSHRHAVLWRVQRPDNVILWLTDHDHKLIGHDGATYTPMGSFDPSAIRRSNALEPQNFDVRAALTSGAITFDDLRAGRWDETEIDEYWVDWLYPWAGPLQHSRYWIVEVTFDGDQVTAQVSGIPHFLRYNAGRLHNRACDADLFDDRCGLAIGAFQETGTVNVVDEDRIEFTMSNITNTSDGFNDDGEILWISGVNIGVLSQIRTYVNTPKRVRLHLKTPFSITSGDQFLLTPGCDKTVKTCNDKWSNISNFQGFPDVPGTDELVEVPQS